MGHSYKKIKDSGRVVFDFLDTKGVRGIQCRQLKPKIR